MRFYIRDLVKNTIDIIYADTAETAIDLYILRTKTKTPRKKITARLLKEV